MASQKKIITSEQQYLDLLTDIMKNGRGKEDRTGTGTISVFGRQLRFDLSEGFPLLTTKKMFMKGITHELLWFLQGSSNIKYLVDNNVHIWDDWPYRYYNHQAEKGEIAKLTQEEFVQRIKDDTKFAKKWGELGPVYGVQWRRWKTPDGREIDQISELIQNIKDVASGKSYKSSRRLIISAWNVADIEEMTKAGLPPCHSLFQFYVLDGKLSCQLYQRSADTFLGVPFNIASYALFTMMIAHVTGLKPGEFVHTFGDAHLYLNHLDQVKEQLARKPFPLPRMKINPEVKDIFSFRIDDFTLEGYQSHPAIKAPIAV